MGPGGAAAARRPIVLRSGTRLSRSRHTVPHRSHHDPLPARRSFDTRAWHGCCKAIPAMSKTPLLVGLVGALFLASPIASAGQCAVANIGKACAPSNGGGTCLSATCTDTETDGSTTTTACGFCVELPDNYCSGDEGTACGDGGVCSISGGGAGGGGSVGGPSSMVSYSFGTCEVPTEGGACD